MALDINGYSTAAWGHAAVNFKQFNPMDAQARKDC